MSIKHYFVLHYLILTIVSGVRYFGSMFAGSFAAVHRFIDLQMNGDTQTLRSESNINVSTDTMRTRQTMRPQHRRPTLHMNK